MSNETATDKLLLLQEQMSALLERSQGLVQAISEERQFWEPPADIRYLDAQTLIQIDLPGQTLHDIRIAVDGVNLCIEGERQFVEHGICLRQERPQGAYRKDFLLPLDALVDQMQLEYLNGVLMISIPGPAADEQASD